MTTIHDIISFCDGELSPSQFSDYCHNGLQYGDLKTSVQKIAMGVSASKNFLTKSAEYGADLCICHHGIIFGKIDKIDDILKGRLDVLNNNTMAVAGYHLPLDAHSIHGNNAGICEALGLVNLKPVNVGYTGQLKSPMIWEDFIDLVKSNISSEIPFSEQRENATVSTVCVISGGASAYSAQAKESGADTFLFGELKESAVHEMRERNLNFIAAGHYATEVFGPQRLGDAIAKQFPDIEVQFIEDPCPV